MPLGRIRPFRPLARLGAAVLTLGLVATTAVVDHGGAQAAPVVRRVTPADVTAFAVPKVKLTRIARDLDIPWDVTWVGSTMLITERSGRLWSKRYPRVRQRVSIPLPRLWTRSEAGLMGVTADPRGGGVFYACMATRTRYNHPLDIQVRRYRLVSERRAVAVGGVVVNRIPLSSGRHAGCRLRFGPDGKLYVGTGDAAQGRNPQNKQSLGGKVLRVNADGSIPADNPFVRLGGNARYVWNYGHRNVQGLAFRPGTNQMWSVEQGTYRDDEVNLLSRGGNYGYDPVPGYNESVPMTDTRKYPAAIPARWRSGASTIATCGGTFLDGRQWGRWNGAFVVAALKGQQLRLLRFDGRGHLLQSARLSGVNKGRIRTVQAGPDGNLYVTTSNGKADAVYRVSPA